MTTDNGAGSGRRDLWKFDMHVHSVYSGDSLNKPALIVSSFQNTGVLPLVCDHNTTAGSEAVYHDIRKISPDVPEILAEEIMTCQGEVIGLFLTEMVPAYREMGETLDSIRGKGGLVLVPHPFCSFRGSRFWEDHGCEAIPRIDIVEGFNARVIHAGDNTAAREFAGRHGKPVSVGSDSHLPKDLGRYWLELEPFGTPEELMKVLRSDTVRYPVLERFPEEE